MTVDMDNADRPKPKGHSMKQEEAAGAVHPRVPKVSKPTLKNDTGSREVRVVSHKHTPLFFSRWEMTPTDMLALLAISVVAVVVRCYGLSTPGSVVFDEVHFGKFAGKYINGTYFYDLHPPLAKMMFAVAGKLAGYD
ncbi:Dolichyl-phosphate-mannose--protein mannosyltransferase 1, partial [Coemansia sp. RSA 1285]